MDTIKKGDIIVVTDISRLTRNCLSFLDLEEKGIIIETLTDDQSSLNDLKESIKAF